MKILLVSRGVYQFNQELAGGAERLMLRTAGCLATRGHEVHLVADCEAGVQRDLESQGARVHAMLSNFLPNRSPLHLGLFGWIIVHIVGNISAAMTAALIIRRGRFDVVHTHGAISTILLRLLFWHLPLVYTMHDAGPWLGEYPSRIERWIRKFAFVILELQAVRASTATTVVFSRLRQHLTDYWSTGRGKLYVVAPGVDSRHSNAREGCERHGVVFAGHLIRRKGADLLPDIARAIPGLTLTVIGDGPLRQKIEREVRSHDLANRVKFVGIVPNGHVRDCLARARVLLLPSRSEGLPLTVLESLSSGTPVVAFDVGGLSDVVESGRNGYLVPPSNIAELIGALEKCLAQDEQQTRFMSQNARNTAETTYSWEAVAEHLESVYANAVRE